MRRGAWLEQLTRDVRDGLRTLYRYPVFTASAVLTLGIAMAANTTMVGVVNALLRPLPVPQAEQLTVLATTREGDARIAQRLSYPDYLDYKTSASAFAGMTAWTQVPVAITAERRTDRVIAAGVVGDYFSVLGLQPAVGRLISPVDGERGGGEAHSRLGSRVLAAPIRGRPLRSRSSRGS